MSKNVVATAFALSLICLPAKADIITVTETGIINGLQGNAVWGLPNGPPTVPVTLIYVFDTSITNGWYWPDTQLIGGSLYADNHPSPIVSASVTINGHTESVAGDFYGEAFQSAGRMYYNAESLAPCSSCDDEYIFTDIISPFNKAPATFQNFVFPTGETTRTTYFSLYDDNLMLTNGSLNISRVVMEVTPTVAVPGPIVGAGIPGLLALFGMGGLYWRRKQLAG